MGLPEPKARILVAEDNLNLRNIIVLFLRAEGYEVEQVGNGRDAVDAALRHPPDLILLDVMMPVMDGFTACRKIKSLPELRGTPVIICTARGRKNDFMAAIRCGAEDYIIKPFTRETILRKVAKVIHRSRTASSSGLLTVENRNERRVPVNWKVSWGKAAEEQGLPALFKARVIDISFNGFAFQFNRCDFCTGYEKGTVHPLCLLSNQASRFAESREIEFILNVKEDLILEVSGKVAHILQFDGKPNIETIGVAFSRMSDENRRFLDNFLREALSV